MKKVLIVTSTASMIDQFLLPSITLLQEMGYEVNIACNFISGNTCTPAKIASVKKYLEAIHVSYFQVDIVREVFDFKAHVRAYKDLVNIISNGGYSFVHCHSPIGGVIARLATRKTKVKVFYTAHGFHFYKGAPLKNWVLYYPVEKICSHFTDVLITINHEDYNFAQQKLRAKKVFYVPGVGVDTSNISRDTSIRKKIREQYGIPADKSLLLSVGELNLNKNHEIVIRAIAKMPGVYYMVAGQGFLRQKYEALIKELNIEDRVMLLGFCNDILDLYNAADLFVFPSFREGLSVSLMEAMAIGLPVACSKIRGNVDLIDADGGRFFDPHDEKDISAAINAILEMSIDEKMALGMHNKNKILQFDIEKVNRKLRSIYEENQ